MSTILKALRKLETDQHADPDAKPASELQNEVLVEPGEPLIRERRTPALGAALWVAAVAGLLLGAVWWWSAQQEAEPLLPTPAARVSSTSAATPAEPSAPAALAAPQAAASVSLAVPPAAAPPPPSQPAQPSQPSRQPVGAEPLQAPRAPALPSRVAVPPPAPAARPEPVASRPPAPARPQPRQESVPDVAVARLPPEVTVLGTIWHPDAKRRRATVQLRGHPPAVVLREGDALGTLVVAEIEPSGVVFLYEGHRLHRAVRARP